MDHDEREQFRAGRRAAGLRIDAATAEVFSSYGEAMDPYGIDPELPNELGCTGLNEFVRSPDNDDGWVYIGDLPETTRVAIRDRFRDGFEPPAPDRLTPREQRLRTIAVLRRLADQQEAMLREEDAKEGAP